MLKDQLVPHEGNGYRPKVLAGEVIVGLLLLVIFVQGAVVLQREVVFKHTDFLASVLPGVLVSLTNADRSKNGVGELTENALLAKAAKLKAEDMAAKGYFAHVTPDGKEPWHWLELAGYQYEYAGENLAVDFEDSKDVEEAWMDSPTHRANIVKGAYTEVGIATAQGTYKGEEVTFVVQFFGSPKAVAAAPVAPVPETPEPVIEEEVVVAETPMVLGEEEVPVPLEETPPAAPIEEAVVAAAASPAAAATVIFSVLLVAVGIMLGIAIAAHMRAPYVEGLSGAFALLVVVVGLMAFNSFGTVLPEVPSAGQSASVRAAF